MKTRRIYFLLGACLAGIGAAFAQTSATAQQYPIKPVRVIVAFSAGGTTDILARAIGQKLTQAMGQQFIVDNRPGAGGTIGTDMVAKSPPDGYTLVIGSTSSIAVNVSLYAKLPYDPVRDLTPVMQVATGAFVIAVHPSLPASNVRELIALAKSRPGQLNFGSSGNGTSLHLAAELLKSMAGINMTHVPYKGASAAIPDLVAGQLQLMFSDMPPFAPHVAAGRLRAIAVTTSKRSSVLPNLPTVAESGVPGYEATSWYGYLAPAGTSRRIIDQLVAELTRAVQSADMKERYNTLGIETYTGTPEQFGAYIQSEMAKWAEVVKKSGAKLE